MASPREEVSTKTGELLYRIGHYDSNDAYFKGSLLSGGAESPVYEGGEDPLRSVAEGFEEWLKKRCEAVRKSFNKKQWEAIENGPPPFNEREAAIVEARRNFQWKLLGVSADGDVQFEVFNGSEMILPFLTVGIEGKVRGKDHVLKGGVWLPVGDVLPQQKKIIEKDCYKDLIDPHDVIAFDKPDPGPEDRDRYWEFKEERWHS